MTISGPPITILTQGSQHRIGPEAFHVPCQMATTRHIHAPTASGTINSGRCPQLSQVAGPLQLPATNTATPSIQADQK
ncbi:hypothetical protein LIA77_09865 [Sarocladium implicatum]|nr:hypothetical protein LIA77_09865 [Sarocladium implicatum]